MNNNEKILTGIGVAILAYLAYKKFYKPTTNFVVKGEEDISKPRQKVIGTRPNDRSGKESK